MKIKGADTKGALTLASPRGLSTRFYGMSEGQGGEAAPGFGRSRTGAHPAKLDSDKFGDEEARPNRWLD